MNKTSAKRIIAELQTNKKNFKTGWEDISTYVAPTRGIFNEKKMDEKKEINHKVLLNDACKTGIDTLSAGMLAGLTSPSREWFKLKVSGNNDIQAERWANSIKNLMEYIFQKSNLYNTLNNIYQETAVFGTGCFAIEHDFDNVISCTQFTINEYAIAYDSKGFPNIFGREFFMSALQLVEDFGYNNCSDAVKREYDEERYSTQFKVYHLICPNKNIDKTRRDNKNFIYSSVYWQPDGNKFLRESGYNYFPVIAPRWGTNTSSDTYGTGIGDTVLGDSKMLQKLESAKLIAIEKTVKPPMMASSSIQGKVNTKPDGITRFNGLTDKAVYPVYKIELNLPAIKDEISKTEQRILSHFYYDVFLMLNSQDYSRMTATEVAERHQEKLMVLGPVLQRLNSELLDKIIEITFHIMLDNGLIPEPPQSIQGKELKVEYVSAIAQAQKAQGLSVLNQGIAFIGQLAVPFPEVIDVINPDKTALAGLKMIGFDADSIRSDSERAELRQMKAEKQAENERLMREQIAIEQAKKLSETKLNQGSALDAIQGGR